MPHSDTLLEKMMEMCQPKTADHYLVSLLHRADSTRVLPLSSECILLGWESMLIASESLLLCGLE